MKIMHHDILRAFFYGAKDKWDHESFTRKIAGIEAETRCVPYEAEGIFCQLYVPGKTGKRKIAEAHIGRVTDAILNANELVIKGYTNGSIIELTIHKDFTWSVGGSTTKYFAQ